MPTYYSFDRNGPSEIAITGNLKNWGVTDRLHMIEVPTLALHGSDGEAQDVTIAPYFWHALKAKWVTIQAASHFTYVDKRDEVMKLAGEFFTYASGTAEEMEK